MKPNVNCTRCGTAFYKKPVKIREAQAHYCSRACHVASQRQAAETPNVECTTCGRKWYKKPSTLNASGRHFCSKECRSAANKVVRLPCGHCGKEVAKSLWVVEHRRGSKFYCNRECRAKAADKRVTVRCDVCGKAFERKRDHVERGNKHTFCGRACMTKWQSEHSGGENNPRWKDVPNVECANCGAGFRARPYRQARGGPLFCGRKCQGQWQTKNWNRENNPAWKGENEVPCANCGKNMRLRPYLLTGRNRRFCGRECMHQWQSANWRGENHHNFSKVAVECGWCAVPIQRNPYQVAQHKHHFCSRACFGKWVSKNQRGANCPAWRGGLRYYRGPNWPQQSRAARERDGFRCQACGRHQAALGRKLDVHHITPYRDFDGDHKRANDLGNLISLCRLCHRRAETGTIPIQPRLLHYP